jgi:hypothetical protein
MLLHMHRLVGVIKLLIKASMIRMEWILLLLGIRAGGH